VLGGGRRTLVTWGRRSRGLEIEPVEGGKRGPHGGKEREL